MGAPIPENLPLLLDESDEGKRNVINSVLKNPDDIKSNLLALGQYWKVKVWFSEPVERSIVKQWVQAEGRETGYRYSKNKIVSDVHTFPGFFNWQGRSLCYKFKRGGRRGDIFPDLKLVTKYEPVINSAKDEFDIFEKFKAKFDPSYITEEGIQSLWDSKSSQHGGDYRPSDFRKIGKVGKQVLRRFLTTFKGINDTPEECYRFMCGDIKYISERHTAYRHPGRDISISHSLGVPYVHYSSEYSGCGNGRYGILANKNEYLWLEDD